MKTIRKNMWMCALLGLMTLPAMAQSEVYKCSQPDGNMLYINDPVQMKGLRCERTGISTSSNPRQKTVNLSTRSMVMPVVATSAKPKDDRRAFILGQELSQEQSELKSVTQMLNTSDASQKEKLLKMQASHLDNIASLKKALGINGNVELMVNPQALSDKVVLPLSMPDSASKEMAANKDKQS